jgi:predicted nucleic acid-binding protein
MLRLFLDANVLLSAAHSPSGRAAALLRLARAGHCRLVTSRHAIEEAARNLAVKAPDREPDLAAALAAVDTVTEAAPRIVSWAAASGLPECDAPVLAAAVTARADLLVTGDRSHFGHLFGERVGGVEVVSLRDALARVLEAAERSRAAP